MTTKPTTRSPRRIAGVLLALAASAAILAGCGIIDIPVPSPTVSHVAVAMIARALKAGRRHFSPGRYTCHSPSILR